MRKEDKKFLIDTAIILKGYVDDSLMPTPGELTKIADTLIDITIEN